MRSRDEERSSRLVQDREGRAVSTNTLTDGVPKVPEGCLGGFWHFWHPLTLAIQKVALLGKSAKRRLIGGGLHRDIKLWARIHHSAHLSIAVARWVGPVLYRRVYRRVSGALGLGLCSILDMDFREHLFYDVRE